MHFQCDLQHSPIHHGTEATGRSQCLTTEAVHISKMHKMQLKRIQNESFKRVNF